MPDFAIQLDRLDSPNKNTRYDACEELRVAEQIPPEAISALEAASNDPDPGVADAARRALLAHQQEATQPVEPLLAELEEVTAQPVEPELPELKDDATQQVEPVLPELKEVTDLYKSIRGWTITLLIFGGLSLFASGTFNPGWGIVMIVIGLLSWKIKSSVMLIIYAVMIGWAALMNGLVALGDLEVLWLGLAVLQVIWTISIVKQYRKYRHLRLRELYEAGHWPANLAPPLDESQLSGRFAIASAILAGITMVLFPVACIGLFAFIILLEQPMAGQAAWLNQFPYQVTGMAIDVMVGIAVLSLGLGLAAILSHSQRKKLAITGAVMSAIILVSWFGFIIITTIIDLMSRPGPGPATG